MGLDLFPSRYADHIRLETEQKIREVNRELGSVGKSESGCLEFMGCLVAGPFFGGLIGLVIWIFFREFLESLSITHDSMLSTIVISIIIGTIISLLLFISSKTDEQNDLKKASKRQKELKAKCEQTIIEYESQFEAEAKKLSANFVGSMLTNKVADWITFCFVELINSANRNSYIEIISIPIKFMVYKEKIICEDGTYHYSSDNGTFSFLLQRCKNLESALEQKAIAYAIASTIYLNIKKRYPKDISGTDVAVHINYTNNVCHQEYVDPDHVTVTMTYTAENGNYQPPNEWTN